jgi:hypothetical protein
MTNILTESHFTLVTELVFTVILFFKLKIVTILYTCKYISNYEPEVNKPNQ